MNDTLTERYKLSSKVFAEGLAATLQTAEDLRTHKSVMLKFPLNPEEDSERERIKREARAYRLLSGVPGLPKFFGYEENEGHPMGPFFAMELLAGKTLYVYLKSLKKRALPESQAIEVARTLCQILDEVHARGIVHRDISINNVLLLDETKRVRLIDFGLALVPNEAGLYDSYDDGRVGTEETRAPEVSASFPGDTRSDIYSLGKLLYQMANGTKKKAVHEMPGLSPEAVSRVSKALSAVIERCTQHDPDERYQSVLELDQALAEITEQEPVKAPAKIMEQKPVKAPSKTTPQPVATSPWFGALLLVGVFSPLVGVVSSVFIPRLSWGTPTPQHLPATSPASIAQPPTPAIVAPPQHATTIPTSNVVIVVEKRTQPELAQTKQTKPKTEKPTEAPASAPTPVPAPVLASAPAEEEEEFKLDPELLKYISRPLPLAEPRPIEIRVELKETKKRKKR